MSASSDVERPASLLKRAGDQLPAGIQRPARIARHLHSQHRPQQQASSPQSQPTGSSSRVDHRKSAARGLMTSVQDSVHQQVNGCVGGIVIEEEEAKRRWPDRKRAAYKPMLIKPEAYESPPDFPGPAVAHLHSIFLDMAEESNAVRLDEISLGDCVRVQSEEVKGPNDSAHFNYMQVTEIWQDDKGQRWFKGAWFWHEWDSSLKVSPRDATPRLALKSVPRRLFSSTEVENTTWTTEFHINALDLKVKVVQLQPGEKPPSDPDTFFWSLLHDREFGTFIDPVDNSAAIQARQKGTTRHLAVLDLYSGAGGASEMDCRDDDVIIETKYAVDLAPPMVATFRANRPNAHVFCMSVDAFLMLCQAFARLSKSFPDDSPFLNELQGHNKARGDVISIEQVRTNDPAKVLLDEKAGSESAKRAAAMRYEDAKAAGADLEFLVKRRGKEDTWLKEKQITNKHLLAKWVKKVRDAKEIPLPGDIDVVVGGPPCQSITGHNRHGTRKDVLSDPKNSQVKTFCDVVEFFNPAFVLMENVMDIMKKEDGAYYKHAQASFISMNYQTRYGAIDAMAQGLPQGRWRCFIWGAKSGKEMLPAFPEPVHKSAFPCGLPIQAQLGRVSFRTQQAFDEALPPVLIGDTLRDLPPVSNYTFAERAQYLCDPSSPFQAWIRRDPPSWQASRQARANAADKLMRSDWEHILKGYRGRYYPKTQPGSSSATLNPEFLYGLGLSVLNSGSVDHIKDLRANLGEAFSKVGLKEELEMASAAQKRSILISLGLEVHEGLVAAGAAVGPVRDHRPLVLNSTDYLRVKSVPKVEGAGYKNFEGVHVTDGFACGGHIHAEQGKCPACGVQQSKAKRAKTSAAASSQAQSFVGPAAAGNSASTLGQPEADATSTQAQARDNGREDSAQAAAPAAETGQEHAAQAKKSKGRGKVSDLYDGAILPGFLRPGCSSYLVMLPDWQTLCPRWAVSFKDSKAGNGCYGRRSFVEVWGTVVGRAEPHNICIIHPEQDRVFTIRENARAQGFPDYYALVGLSNQRSKRQVRDETTRARYVQMGNAWAGPVASALGRCLSRAAAGTTPYNVPVINVHDPAYIKVVQECRSRGMLFEYEKLKVKPEHIEKQLRAAERDLDRWLNADRRQKVQLTDAANRGKSSLDDAPEEPEEDVADWQEECI